MNGSGEEDRYREFEASWRDWVNRPARQSPRQAAARVTGALRMPVPKPRLWLPAAVAASLLATIAISTLWVSNPVRPPVEHGKTALIESQQLAPGQVVFWLDESTPLYMNFQPPGDNAAGGGVR